MARPYKGRMDSRASDERKEPMETINNDAPSSKFQNTQQVADGVKTGQQTEVPDNTLIPQKKKAIGSTLKQERIANVITGAGGSDGASDAGAALAASGLRTMTYSGNEGTILGSASGTPYVGEPSRSNTRPGQKLDAVSKRIDTLACEQAVVEVEGSKPLQDNPGDVQGYLGHPANTNARMQKTSGAVPQDINFQRSIDEITRDEFVHADGMYVRDNSDDSVSSIMPTTTYDPNGDTSENQPDIFAPNAKINQIPYHAPLGNYNNTVMKIGVDGNGNLISLTFDFDGKLPNYDSDVVNASSTALRILENRCEMDRQKIDTEAGQETENNWSPLARAVAQPTQTVAYLAEIEREVGTEAFLAYRFGNKSLAYQLNKAAKDGQKPYSSFREILYGYTVNADNSRVYEQDEFKDPLHDKTAMLAGSPALMIRLYDSPSKYSKRGDIFTQPRSFKMHLQTADNNINQFRMKPDTAKYIAARDAFSSIDHEPDALMPICLSDNWIARYGLTLDHAYHRKTLTYAMGTVGGKGTTAWAVKALWDAMSDKTLILPHTGKCFCHSDGVRAQDIEAKYVNVGTFTSDSDAKAALVSAFYNYIRSAKYPEARVFLAGSTDGAVNAVFGIMPVVNASVFPTLTANTDYELDAKDTSVSGTIYLDYTKVESGFAETVVCNKAPFTYQYHNKMNVYTIEVKHPFAYGIERWAQGMAGKLWEVVHSNDDAKSKVYTFKIPMIHSTTNISTYDYIVCAAVPFMQLYRANSMLDVLNYEKLNGHYPFSDLETLESLNPKASIQYTNGGIMEPNKAQQMTEALALTWKYPELFWRIHHSVETSSSNSKGSKAGNSVTTTEETYAAPWYVCAEAYMQGDGRVLRRDDGFVTNYPMIRTGSRHSLVDSVLGFSERDVRLIFDQLTVMPISGTNFVTQKGAALRYSRTNSGILTIQNNSTDGSYISTTNYMNLPRELGLGGVAPYGYLRRPLNLYSSDNRVAADDLFKSYPLSTGSSYIVRIWRNRSERDGFAYPAVLADTAVNISRAGNFAQDWVSQQAAIYVDSETDSTATLDIGSSIVVKQRPDIGVALAFSDIAKLLKAANSSDHILYLNSGDASFVPFSDLNTGRSTTELGCEVSIFGFSKLLWTYLQMLPFVISPFDVYATVHPNGGETEECDAQKDVMDNAAVFGFAGFFPSDYREDISNKLTEVLNLGFAYLKDSFIAADKLMQ